MNILRKSNQPSRKKLKGPPKVIKQTELTSGILPPTITNWMRLDFYAGKQGRQLLKLLVKTGAHTAWNKATYPKKAILT